MALARLCLRNLQQKLSSSSSLVGVERSVVGKQHNQRWNNREVLTRRFTSTSAGEDEKQGRKEVSVSDDQNKSSRVFPRRRGRRGLWRTSSDRHLVPSLYDFFPSGLGNALMEATENINRLIDNLNMTTLPSQLTRVKEQDDFYKLRYEVPGLTKDDLKITVADGVLTIKGERRAEDEESVSLDDESWSSGNRSYGHYYYNMSVALPEDAKVEDIKAELKDGVVAVVIPRTQRPKKEVKEIAVH